MAWTGRRASQLGAQVVPVPRDAAERDPQQAFAHPAAVIGRGVDEVHAQVEGDMDRAQRLVDIDGAKFLPQRRGAECQPGELQAGAAQAALSERGTMDRTRATV